MSIPPKSIRVVGLIVAIFGALMIFGNFMGLIVWNLFGIRDGHSF